MRTGILIIGTFLCLIVLFSGCRAAYEDVRETIYMQDARLKVPILQTPVFLNTGDSAKIIEITPRIFIGSNKSFGGSAGTRTRVNEVGVYQVDTVITDGRGYYVPSNMNMYDAKNNNYEVAASTANVGLDVDLNLSRVIVLSGGYNFSKIRNTNLEGYRVGLGFKDYNSPYGIRFDGGLLFQESYYDVSSIIERSTKDWESPVYETTAMFFKDEGIQNNMSFYMNLNLTISDASFPFGGFLNVGYLKQTLLDLEPKDYDRNYYFENTPFYFFEEGSYSREDLRSSIETAYFNFTPGFLFTLYPSARLVGGVRFVIETGNEERSANNFISPFVQLQLSF